MPLPRWGQRQGGLLILQVHHQDPIETIEILRPQRSSALRRHIDAMRACHTLRALVWRTTDVIAVGAGGIGFHRKVWPAALRQ
jgi:hypothetical protein